ncbi:MAG TPA: amidohydrolase family protein [Candidatus Binataceae bacterium]|jgi:predicted TIM-barrel fold metal-dependent hydrolase|nr:amidohydrolase family protein [Candidatus Binataceae bacterium]
MALKSQSKSAAVRARLSHPVIDSDGHQVEYGPRVRDYVKEIAGREMADRVGPALDGTIASTRWYRESPAQRREFWTKRSPFWGLPTKNTLDLATSLFPKLMCERLDDMGLDFCVLYPSLGLVAAHFDDAEVRRATSRALNRYCADIWGEYPQRIAPVATIPMHTPREAVEELDYAVNVLGMRAVLMPSYVKRPIPAAARQYPQADQYTFRLDTFGIDSEYDYDPVWARCQQLKVVPSFHSHGEGWGSRTSISNYVYNHVGHFASSADAVCKSLFLGGVTRRFPNLRFSFLEGGVGWARSLFADLIGHWEKRNLAALANYDPSNIDQELLAELSRRYGGKVLGERESVKGREVSGMRPGDPSDDFANCAITRKEDFRDLFLKPFFFGCEADDPITASAFDAPRNPMSARLNAIYGSDIGHFDVPDMSEVTAEAFEAVEHGRMTGEDFRDFVFANPIKLWTALNPDFFKGTAVESAVAKYLAQDQ